MPRPPRTWAPAAPAAVLLLALGGCGSGSHSATHAAAVEPPQTSCAATVAYDVSRVVRRVYHEGVSSERTEVAKRQIAASAALSAATAAANAPAARAVAEALVAQGHMTNLRVVRGGAVLTDVGGPALAPLNGQVLAAPVKPDAPAPPSVGSYVTSVWSDEGFLAESNGISEGRIDIRAHGRSVGGSLALPPGRLPAEGTAVVGGVRYAYASFGGTRFPSGAVRIYVLRSVASAARVCGATREATTRATMARIARLIYAGEAGRRTLPQVRRVQADPALLQAVAARDPLAARKAVEALLNQHIVRMRVLVGGRVLTDVGGPYVLAPVSAPLRLGGRTIGTFVLSIQDDEGYLRLTRRLAGLRALMYAGQTLVKNSLGPEPGAVPASGRYSYRGATYQVYTLHAAAFPSGPLTIRVLIPVPFT